MIDENYRRPRTLDAQKGFDMARRLRDHVRETQRMGHRVDLIALSPSTLDLLQRCWLEIAPELTPFPEHIEGIPYTRQDMGTHEYAFLRDYTPWEKRRALETGDVLYGDDKKKVLGAN